MNMQDENRKFGNQTAQSRTDDTAVTGVNWPTTLGGEESTMGIRSQVRKRGKIGLKQSLPKYTTFSPHCHFNFFICYPSTR
jgi:hypothetical protein